MNHGRDGIYIACDDDKDKEGAELETIVAGRFKFVHFGHSFRCTEIEAALGIGQLAKAEAMMKRRREIAARFISHLSKHENRIQLPHTPPDREHSYMLFGLALRDEPKDKLVNFLEARNIETRELLPLLNQPVYKRHFGDLEDKYPVAKWVNRSGFYIGCHGYMTDEEVDFVIEAFDDYFRTS